MAKFSVEVEKRYYQIGWIEVDVEEATPEAAVDALCDMIDSESAPPLLSTDPRITWDEPQYEDATFRATGCAEPDLDE